MTDTPTRDNSQGAAVTRSRRSRRWVALAVALAVAVGGWLAFSGALRGEDRQVARGVEVPFYDADGKVRWVAKARVAERIGGMAADSADAGALRFTRVRLLLPRRIDGRDSLLALVADGGEYNAGAETLLLDGNVRGAVYPEERVSFATPADYSGAPEQYLPPGADLSFSARALSIRWVYDKPIDGQAGDGGVNGNASNAPTRQPRSVPQAAMMAAPRAGGRPVLESSTRVTLDYRTRGYHLEGNGMRAFDPPGTLTILSDAQGTIADARVLQLEERAVTGDEMPGSAVQPWVLAFSTEGPATLETEDRSGLREGSEVMPRGSSIRAITLRRSVRLTQHPSSESLQADEVDIRLRLVEAAAGMTPSDGLPGGTTEHLTTRRLELERFEARGRVRLTLPDALDLSANLLTWANSGDATGTTRQDCKVTGLNRCRLWLDPARDPLSLLGGGHDDGPTGLATVTDSDRGGFITLSTTEGKLHLQRDIYAAPDARSVIGVETWLLGRGARVERFLPHPSAIANPAAAPLPESAAYYLYGMMDASEGATIVQDLREVRRDPLDSVGSPDRITIRDLAGFDVRRTGTRALIEVYTPDRVRLVTVHGDRLVHRREVLPTRSDGSGNAAFSNLPSSARQIWHSVLAGPRPQVTWLSDADWRLAGGGAQPSPGTQFRYALMGKGALTMVDFADLDGRLVSRMIAQRDDVLFRKSVLSDDTDLQDDARLLLRCEAFGLRFGLGPTRELEPIGFRASNVADRDTAGGRSLIDMLRDPACPLLEIARNVSADLSREVPLGMRAERVLTATVGRDRFRTPEVHWLRSRRPATVSPTAPVAVTIWDDVLALAGPFDASAESAEIREVVPLWKPSGERIIPARVTLSAATHIGLHTVWERLGEISQWTRREISLDGAVRLQAFGPDPGPAPTFDPELLMQTTCAQLLLRWERPVDPTVLLPPSSGPLPSQYPERLTYGLATGPVRHEDNVRGLTATGDRLTLTWTAPDAESARPRDAADVAPHESVLALPGQRLVLEGSPRIEVRNIYTEHLSITDNEEAEPRVGVLTFDAVPANQLEAAGLSPSEEPGRIELYGDTMSARIVPNGRIAWISMPQREPDEKPFNLLDELRGRTEAEAPEVREDEIDRLTLSAREIFIMLAEVENRFELVGLEAISQVQISEGQRQGRGDYLRWTEAGGRRAMLTGDIPVFRERRGDSEVFRLEGVQQYEYAEHDEDNPGRRHIITGRARQPGSESGDRIRLTIDVPGLPGSPSELLRGEQEATRSGPPRRSSTGGDD